MRSPWLSVSITTTLVLAASSMTLRAAPPEGAADFAGQLVKQHAWMFNADELKQLDRLNRVLRQAADDHRRARDDQAREAVNRRFDKAGADLLRLIDGNSHLIDIVVRGDQLDPASGEPKLFPGDAGALLFRIKAAEGPTRCIAVTRDFEEIHAEKASVESGIPSTGTVYAVVGLTNVPANRTHMSVQFNREGAPPITWPVDVLTPRKARLHVRIIDEETGQETPAMVRLVWKTGGDAYKQPPNAIDIAEQFESQGNASSLRPTNIQGRLGGDYWCVPGGFEVEIAPGDWFIAVRRGIEHEPLFEEFSAESGATIERTFRIKRWVDMRRKGWFSGDDHVHHRILSDEDARRLMTWVKAEDLHLSNVVKMGDIYRTWFEQRGFGRDYRVVDGDYVLCPGQECPRTHAQIGHTISMNISNMVRDTDRYFSYDWVAKQVHEMGGLWGYAHVCSKMFFVHRDMSMNIPEGNVDFVELLQFANLNTDLYYEFLNLGYKVTAGAGSDVPWGGTVGEVRIYARVDQDDFNADTWFDSMGKGHTFVTNGPMIEFQVDDALPGDEIVVDADRKLHVKARAYGDPGRMKSMKLEIVRHGEVIKTIESQDTTAEVEFDVDAGYGGWIAARVVAGDNTRGHTTPVYVIRKGFRFWDVSKAEDLIKTRLSNLKEVEKIVAEARQATDNGTRGEDRAVRQLALQGDALLRRAEKAARHYAELTETLKKERDLRK